ncbi:uncharacterized protein LOC120354403 [Nilaparvata lugens]|uniref:uncharacterized protein LOC120354359 n=1 Tax=Nilaparvata lugens TaxID=108931 RepID=UPI00193D09B9|nr:uncharacterized protein LOC120354359 [Nilaparvata lugens]XP_039297439.1 uncharacterized protein LOC120354403 [Nilaparvata lugens]
MSDSESDKSVDIFDDSEDDFIPPTSSDPDSESSEYSDLNDETNLSRRERLVRKIAPAKRKLIYESVSSTITDEVNKNMDMDINQNGEVDRNTGTDNRHDICTENLWRHLILTLHRILLLHQSLLRRNLERLWQNHLTGKVM